MSDMELGTTLSRGSRGIKVRLVQEWLTLHDLHVAVDGAFGPATEFAVRQFQKKKSLPQTGRVTRETFDELVAPMSRAAAGIEPGGRGLGALVVAFTRQHLKEHPREVGGQNSGPWVRLYMNGNEGAAWPWCAGFVSFVLNQACRSRGVSTPIQPSFSCDSLAASAKQRGRFVSESEAGTAKPITPGAIFLNRRTPTDWVHTGIVLRAREDVFETIEGNTNDQGSREGFEVCQRIRGYTQKDFILV